MQSAPRTLRSATRLRLKPKGPATGHVDGAWWPRSHDLGEELPALVAVLGVRLNGVERLTYHLDSWPGTPRRRTIDGRSVRLEGFHSQTAGTVTAVGPAGRLTLLVVPPETEPEAAHDLLMAAAHRDHVGSVTALLEAEGVPRYSAGDIAAALRAATDRWEADGGQLPRPRTESGV
ncbi:DUF5994 family protein [Amycolatopsis lurida]